MIITTCPRCALSFDVDIDAEKVTCPKCRLVYHWQDDDDSTESDPDYGGAFDGFNVSSDADPGL
jgi:hypothetical protein